MNYYELEPREQRELSARRLIAYLRDYIEPYHPFLRKLYRQHHVDIRRLRTADDLRRLPIVDKDSLREDPQAFILRPRFPGVPHPPEYDTAPIRRTTLLKYLVQAALNRPREYTHLTRYLTLKDKIRRRALLEWMPIHFHASTGSTGTPTPAVYTHYDLTHVLPLLTSGLIIPKQPDPEEPYYDYDERAMNIFPGAPHLAFFAPVLAKMCAGASSFETFGGSVIPTDRQIVLFAQGGFSSITSIPSYMVHWLRRAKLLQQAGTIGPLTNFKRVALGAEPVSESLREHIRSLALELGAHPRFRIFQTLGMTEMKWAFWECCEGSGIHLNPVHHYWELLHPETREPVAEGEPGVLVFSHIGWRGTALVRYWTGDLIKGGYRWTRCEHCGYTFPRVYPPICRAVKDFTKIKGTRVDLSLLVETVRDTPGVRNFQITLDSEDQSAEFSRDLLTVYVLAEAGHNASTIDEQLHARLKSAVEVSPDRIVFEQNEAEMEQRLFARTGIKAEYVLERRKLHV
ncbi:MAG: hypothetical protein K1X74_02745 [Pirellulales bacterium]|nr:hypothetical protein [Pirellulales bacterium]